MADLGQPDAVLVVSGELDGYLEPCGCTRGQAGGLVRRHEFLGRLAAQGWPTALIDMGHLVEGPARSLGGAEQSRIKLLHALKALRLMNYGAVAGSLTDVAAGHGRAEATFRDALGGATAVVVANPPRAGELAAIGRASTVLTAGSIRIGVTAVLDPSTEDGPAGPDLAGTSGAIPPPGEALPGVLADLESRSDYQVLMVRGPYEFARPLAEANSGFDVVIASSGENAPRGRHPDRLNGGRTTLINIGGKGQYLGVFAFYRDQPSRPPAYHLVALTDAYDGPGGAMKTLIRDEYRAALKEARVVEDGPDRGPAAGPPGATSLGARACAACHPRTYEKWATTKHASAFAALLGDPRPDTAFDAECVSCHTTGFGDRSGWRSQARTPHLAGNQCENCHGAGSKHAEAPDDDAFRRAMIPAPDRVRQDLCLRCHDADNSPDFDFVKYLERIRHKGLDDYRDPATHRGPGPVEGSSSRPASSR